MTIDDAFFVLEHGSGEGLKEYLEAIKIIKENCVPVVHAKWVLKREAHFIKSLSNESGMACGSYTRILISCSNCNKTSDFDTPFCPQCGAKMDNANNEKRIVIYKDGDNNATN